MATEIGPLVMRRSIFIQAAPERVFRELESFERLQLWYGLGHRLLAFEPKVGGAMELYAGPKLHYAGRVLVVDPPRELTFESEWLEGGWPAPTLITLRLTPALGGTVVELLHHGFERLGKDAAELHRGYEEGWRMIQLAALRELVEG
jgi:uncharacterized protein YndB with AHSA1/START domain